MVHFGTAGWRGIVGQELTFRKIRLVIQAIIDVLHEERPEAKLILVGFDTRMLSEKFARSAAQVVAGNGLEARLPARDIPAPALSSAILELGADAGILFTASHNPPEYNGLKYYTAHGTLAPKDTTDRIERRYAELEPAFDDVFIPRPDLLGTFCPKPAYLDRLQKLIDWDAIRAAGLSVAVDPLYGTTREYLDHILLENGVRVSVIHNTRDPFFGGYAPECTSANLTRLRDLMRQTGADLGLSTDGDGDRFGILDQGARLKDSSIIIGLLLDYLARRRGLQGRVGRTLATSHLVDAVAHAHGMDVIETPVGFKNFGPLFLEDRLDFAAEESAGLGWRSYLPERDGTLACLLVLEMVSVEGQNLVALTQDLFRRVGTFYFRRHQVPLTRRLENLIERRREQKWHDIDGWKVVSTDRRDGLKLTFEGGGWILIRKAGTEPKVRIYAEGRTQEEMRTLMHLAKKVLTNWRIGHV